MEPISVVLYQNDAETAEKLAASLAQYFPSIYLTRKRTEVRPALARYRAEVLVLDVETSEDRELESIVREFPGLYVVCTHRLANEELWTEVLNQGAQDMCVPWNTEDVVRSVTRDRARQVAA